MSASRQSEMRSSSCAANEVLKNIPRYGYQIVHIGREKMHEMMEFRFILESYCLRKSIRYVTPQNIERLEQLEREVQADIQNNPDYPVTAALEKQYGISSSACQHCQKQIRLQRAAADNERADARLCAVFQGA